MKNLYLILFFLYIGMADTKAQCDPVQVIAGSELVLNNGRIYDQIVDKNVMYMAGGFKTIGNFTGGLVKVDITTGQINTPANWPKIRGNIAGNHSVMDVVEDGSGGVYVAGWMQKVGNDTRTCLAHINGAGQVVSWNPTVTNGQVYRMAIVGSTMYIAGAFTSVNGQPRSRLAALDINTGALTSWNPNPTCIVGTVDPEVYDFIIDGNIMYAGGHFSRIGGQNRRNAAAIDLSTGVVGSWDPNVTGYPDVERIYTMHRSGNTIFLGGLFFNIGSPTRINIGAVDITTGVPTNFSLYTSHEVNDIESSGDTLYVGGKFTTIATSTQRYIAAVRISTSAIIPFPVDIDIPVDVLKVVGNNLYIGGGFSYVNSTYRANICGVNRFTGTLLPWKCHTNYRVQHISTSGNNMYIGGLFTSAGAVERFGLAAIDMDVDTLLPWYPKIDNLIGGTLGQSNNTIYLGGNFSNVNNTPRQYFAEVDKVTGLTVTPLTLALDAYPLTFASKNNTLYIGGPFTSVNSQVRLGFAAVNATTGSLSPLSLLAGSNVFVRQLLIQGDTMYISGNFNQVATLPRNYLAALNILTNQVTAWNPNPSNDALKMKVDNNIMYIGGDFNYIGSQPRHRFAALDLPTGNLLSLNPNVDGRVYSIATAAGKIYIGGDFDNVGGQPHNNIVEVDSITGNASNWQPVGVGETENLVAYGDKLYLNNKVYSTDDRNYMPLFVLPRIQPTVSISADDNIVCTGQTLNFTANTSLKKNGIFQWKVNNTNVPGNGTAYSFIPANNDKVECIVTSAYPSCVSPSSASSNAMVITVNPYQVPTINVSASSVVFPGQTVNLTANVGNAGTTYSIDWYKNGIKFNTTSIPVTSYTKSAGADIITATIRPPYEDCYDTGVSTAITVNDKFPVNISTAPGISHTIAYPNPFVDNITIAQLANGASVEMHDVLGKKINTTIEYTAPGTILLKFQPLRSGVYYIAIKENGKTTIVQKMVKE